MSSLGPETFRGGDEKPVKGKKPKRREGIDRDALLRRSNGLCEVRSRACSGRGNEAHHVLRRSQGGPDDLSNILWACKGCHDFIHKHPAKAYEKGWLLKSGKEK